MAASGRKRKNPSKDSRDSKRAKLDTATAFSDGFDENCIGDEDDQAMLDGLTEVERELILSKRRDARDDMLDMQRFAERSGAGVADDDDEDDDDEEEDEDDDEEEDEDEDESEEDATEVGGKRLRRRSRRANDGSDSEESLTGVDTSGRVAAAGGDGEEGDSDYEAESKAERRRRKLKEFQRKRRGGAAAAGGDLFGEEAEAALLGLGGDGYGDDDEDDEDDFVGNADRLAAADDHHEYDSDVEEEERARQARLEKERLEPLTVRDVNQARLTRQFLLHFFLEPYFKEMVQGMFVRVLLGTDPDSGNRVYRLCRIKQLVRGSTGYDVFVRGEKIKTFRRLEVYQGTQRDTKVFRVMLVSDQRASDEELQAFLHECRAAHTEPPTPAELRRRRRRAERVRKSYNYTTKDIDKMLAMKQASFDPKKVGNLALYKIELEQRIQSLQSSCSREQAIPLAMKEKLLETAGSEPAARRQAERHQREADAIQAKFARELTLSRRHLDMIKQESGRRQGRERTTAMRTASSINSRFSQRNRAAQAKTALVQAARRKDKAYQQHVQTAAVGFIRRERKVEILWKIGAGSEDADGKEDEEKKEEEEEKKKVEDAAVADEVGEGDGAREGEGGGGQTLLQRLGGSPSRPSAFKRGAGRGALRETRAIGGVDVDAALREAIGDPLEGTSQTQRAGAGTDGGAGGSGASHGRDNGSDKGKPKLGLKAYLARKQAASSSSAAGGQGGNGMPGYPS